MMLRTILLPLLALGSVAAAPPLGADRESATQAERRLRACLSASASDRHPTLEAAVLSARAACKPQIEDALDMRIIDATAGLEYGAARVIERRVTRALNYEIAVAIANFTGLPPTDATPHAQD